MVTNSFMMAATQLVVALKIILKTSETASMSLCDLLRLNNRATHCHLANQVVARPLYSKCCKSNFNFCQKF